MDEKKIFTSLDGIGEGTAKLIVESGISSIIDLSSRNAEKINEKFQTMASAKASGVPSVAEISKWITAAKKLRQEKNW